MKKLPNLVFEKGQWKFRCEFDGRVIRIPLGTHRGEAVRRWKIERARFALLRRTNGKLPDRPPTVSQFARQRWLLEYVPQQRLSKNGVDLSDQRLRDYIEPAIGHLPVDCVGAQQLRAVRLTCEAAGLAPRSVYHVLSDVRCLIRYAAECRPGLVIVPSFRQVLPRIPEKEPRPIPRSYLELMLSVARPKESCTIRGALYTGMRWSSQLALRRDQVELRGPRPRARLVKTKTGRVVTVPLIRPAVDAMKDAMDLHETEFVFPYRMKNPCGIVNAVQRRISEPERVHVNWHRLRDTFGVMWLDAGGGLAELKEIYGHSTIRMTERYARASEEAVRRAAQFVESRLAPVTGAVTTSRTDQEVA